MINSIYEFEKIALKAIAEFSFEGNCIYCDWCVNRLYISYSSLLTERLGPSRAALTKECKDQLSTAIRDKTFIIKNYYRNQHRMQRLDIEFELDFRNSEDCAILKLTEAIDNTFQFMTTKSCDLVILMPLLSVEIIDAILTNEYGIDTSDLDRIIGHELLQKEFGTQLKLLNDAKSHNG